MSDEEVLVMTWQEVYQGIRTGQITKSQFHYWIENKLTQVYDDGYADGELGALDE